MKLHSLLLTTFFASEQTTASQYIRKVSSVFSDTSSPAKRDVCVIGGGPAGVYATKLLEDKGYSAVLFDKADSIGGKTNPAEIDIDGSPFSMFRHVLTSDMVLVSKLIDDMGLEQYKETRDLPSLMLSEAPHYVFPAPNPGPETQAAIAKYINLWLSYEGADGLLSKPNHERIPPELMVPTATWFLENDIVPALYACESVSS